MPDTPQYSVLRPKSRILDYGKVARDNGLYTDPSLSGGKGWVYTPSPLSCTGFQTTWSEGHPYRLLGKGKDGKDIGGAFRSEKRYVTLEPGGREIDLSKFPRVKALSSLSGGIRYSGEGPAIARAFPNALSAYPPTLETSQEALYVKGSTAIARCSPTKSTANLSQALIELKRDGLPASPLHKFFKQMKDDTSFKEHISHLSEEYLNYQFGLVPMYNDLKSLYKAIAHSGDIWEQYRRDAGRWVRRGYKFPLEEESSVVQPPVSRGDPLAFPATVYKTSTGTYTVERQVRRDTWFSGAFTYYLPDKTGYAALDSLIESAAWAHHVLGLDLSPETLYNVSPWSWFVDWFVNLGDVITNLSSAMVDKLVMPYGYIMEHVTVTDIYRLAGIEYKFGTQGPPVRQLCLVTETKQRIAATPYGFGLNWDGFSPTQWAILAALGITQGGRAVPHVR